MINRRTLEKLKFRCVEFKNGDSISVDDMVEMDSFQQGCRIKKGIFLCISHYKSVNEVEHVTPQLVGIYRRILTSAFVRYLFIKVSLITKRNIPKKLWIMRARVSEKTRLHLRRYNRRR